MAISHQESHLGKPQGGTLLAAIGLATLSLRAILPFGLPRREVAALGKVSASVLANAHVCTVEADAVTIREILRAYFLLCHSVLFVVVSCCVLVALWLPSRRWVAVSSTVYLHSVRFVYTYAACLRQLFYIHYRAAKVFFSLVCQNFRSLFVVSGKRYGLLCAVIHFQPHPPCWFNYSVLVHRQTSFVIFPKTLLKFLRSILQPCVLTLALCLHRQRGKVCPSSRRCLSVAMPATVV